MNRLMLLGFLLATATAHSAGTLQLGEPTVENGRITVPVILGGDLMGGVSSLDFRFRYNPEALQPVSLVAGAAAEGAEKRVMSNLQTPGEYTVVMTGFNQTACGPGEAIRIVLQRLHGQDKSWDLGLSDATMSSVDGRLIESRVLPSMIEPDRSDDEPDSDEAPRQQPRPSETQEPAADDAGGGAVAPGLAYGGAPEGLKGTAPDGTASRRLKVAMRSAGDARKRIDTPAEDAAGVGEVGEPGDTLGEPADGTGIDATGEGRRRLDMAGVVEAETAAAVEAVGEITVERQSGANAVQTPLEPVEQGGEFLFYGMVLLLVFVLAAASALRRSRLNG